MATEYPIKVGGHRIRPSTTKGKEQQQWTCDDCHTPGPYGLFNIIGQRDFCPARVESMNGYIWFNADDRSVARTRAADTWLRNARSCEFVLEDYTEVHDQPGICATFTWREQAYVVRYGEDAGRGMRANDLRVELAEEKPEQTGA